MPQTRIYCGKCNRIFYNKKPGDAPGRHKTIDPATGKKTGVYCEYAMVPLLVKELPQALPQPCFVCAEPVPVGHAGTDKPSYGVVKLAVAMRDFGHGVVVPETYAGDDRVAGVICQSCMVAGKERREEAWKRIKADAGVA